MEVWSKGLGKKSLNISLGRAEVKSDGRSMFIEGMIEEPVWWEYRITMTADDLREVFDIASNDTAIDFIINSPKTKGLPLKLAGKAAKIMWLSLIYLLKRSFRIKKINMVVK